MGWCLTDRRASRYFRTRARAALSPTDVDEEYCGRIIHGISCPTVRPRLRTPFALIIMSTRPTRHAAEPGAVRVV
jgi:hypothetical protein